MLNIWDTKDLQEDNIKFNLLALIYQSKLHLLRIGYNGHEDKTRPIDITWFQLW
jgi:hypothetical protein